MIDNIIFRDIINGKERNLAAVAPVLEEFGFMPEEDRDNVFILRDFEKTTAVHIEESRIIVHTILGKVKKTMLEQAAQRLLDLNARHAFGLGLDWDGEYSFDHIFMTPNEAIDRHAFRQYFSIYMQLVNDNEDMIRQELRPFLPGLLDEETNPEGIMRHLRSMLHPGDDDDIPLDDDDDSPDDAFDIGSLFERISQPTDNSSDDD